MRAAIATATTPAAASALLSDTAAPPPPVFGAPEGTELLLELLLLFELELLLELLDEVEEDAPELLLELAGAVAFGVALAVAGGRVTATVDPPDLLVDEPLLDEPLLEPPEVFIDMPGMLLMSLPEEDEPEEDLLGAAVEADEPLDEEPDDEEPLDEDVDLAVGSVTATVLPPELEPPEDDDEVDLAVGRVTATVLPPEPVLDEAAGVAVEALVAAGVAVDAGALVSVGAAAGEAAVDVVSFCDQSPISERTPARTAIAMIAPTTQEVLFG